MRQYVSDYLIPSLNFYITAMYEIVWMLGVSVGKSD